MGSGKSTTGIALADRLGLKFMDMDREIEGAEKMSITEIFTEFGEEYFRSLEQDLLQRVVLMNDLVIATGGGVPSYGGNMELMNRNGVTVYLRMGADELYNRLKRGRRDRPLIRDLNDAELRKYIGSALGTREPYYEQAAIIISGKEANIQELAGMIPED